MYIYVWYVFVPSPRKLIVCPAIACFTCSPG